MALDADALLSTMSQAAANAFGVKTAAAAGSVSTATAPARAVATGKRFTCSPLLNRLPG